MKTNPNQVNSDYLIFFTLVLEKKQGFFFRAMVLTALKH